MFLLLSKPREKTMQKWILVVALFFFFPGTAAAQPAPAAETPAAKDAATTKPEEPAVPLTFWQATPPKVNGEIEKRYDINRDKILQSAEIKILLRDVVDEVTENKAYFYNTADSALLKEYDKNKDGIIDNIEIKIIEQDLDLATQ